MDRRFAPPKVHRGLRPSLGRSNHRGTFLALALLALALPLGLPLGSGTSVAHGPMAPAPRVSPAIHASPVPFAPHAQATYGDLIVTPLNSPYVIGTPGQLGSYVLQGNLTVQPGGVLVLQHEILTQQEFVTDTGTTAQRLAHVYTMSDQGTIELNDSSIVSNFQALNPFAKIDLNISNGGRLLLNHSGLDFPGWVTVYGAGSTLNLTNGSNLGPSFVNIKTYPENVTLANDTRYAPTLLAAAGAHVNLFDSYYNGTYAENYSNYGMPGPAVPIVDEANHALTGSAGATWSAFAPAVPDAENLTRAILYQSIVAG
ncbi:MAG TPA: hypothetical protein VMH90_00960, partial [Thermoplasmata archaeon]|nr:hypothetical protein [Thermoplasmata archaeon]